MRSMQKQIIDDLKVKPSINSKQEIRNRVNFLKNYMKKFSFLKSLILGVSGGQDSTLTGKIAQIAISELREETDNNDYQFIAIRLPYGKQADESDAMDAIKFMNADNVIRVDIKQMVDSAVIAVEEDGPKISDFNKGNIKARERMIAQYSIASQKSGAVLGTDHAAEAVTGFYTKFGDGAADITPLSGLDKRQGKDLLRFLDAPKHLYEKVPTADLEDNRPALPDEAALGVRYDDIDDYLEGKDVSDKVALIIEKHYKNTAHKRHLPINIYDTFWK